MADGPKDIDPDVQVALRDLMQDDYPLLLQTFRTDALKRLAQLSASIENEDWEAFRQAAHSFKGSCGNMGAQALQQACEVAETAGGNADAPAARSSYLELRRLFLRVDLLLAS